MDNSTHSIMNSVNVVYPSYYHHSSEHLLSIYHGQPPHYPLYASLCLILIQHDEMGTTVVIFPPFTEVDAEAYKGYYLPKVIQVINSGMRTQNKASLI